MARRSSRRPCCPLRRRTDWDFPAGDAIEVRVEYEFLPKALMTQFIVSRHPDIDRGRTLGLARGRSAALVGRHTGAGIENQVPRAAMPSKYGPWAASGGAC
jgi:hypothetical protein